MVITPSPPIPLLAGSTTQSMKAAAIAASTAFPPFRIILRPASPMRGCFEAIMPLSATQSGLPAPVHRRVWYVKESEDMECGSSQSIKRLSMVLHLTS